ncbi:NAD(P)H-dependent oxidoreductase subunit E [Quisquiliibacterium transsilvanicum]|uniref:Formate dehydrogenase n=1 Tax=Quisquiliibacterium transsilvanicum TaxID=1549638 RepID=A0A7W8M7V5_9BURK|nr:NAD(P)H-dependent oxidoreductase subunit E [Quisquiliibacterium transsilvanicum]MBB5270972.1 formate dehydrogenase [Quisquiliibacterium transsilvanicum]
MQTVTFRRPVGRNKGRQVEPAARERVRALLADAPRRRDLLVEHLHLIQDADGHLSAAMLAALAEEMRLPQAEVFEVASFYHHFDVVKEGGQAPPELTVGVCDSLSCALAGADALVGRLEELLGASVRVRRVPCVGRCAQAPVAVVQRHPVAPATAERVAAAVRDGLRECVPANPSDVRQAYRTLRALLAQGRDAATVFAALEEAGLRGLGGAGFPTGRKWRIVAAEPAPRLMVVNADEGEPGTFKDRVLLEQDPHRVLEGMLIGAWATGCTDCYIYLRDEYAGVRAGLARAIDALRADPPLHPLPGIHLRRGAGAYVCGEESALIESLEGRRGVPRLRPPYVAQAGLFGRPTLVNNVETLWWAPEILARGPQWFAGQGRHGRSGLRAFSVSGRVRQPGVKIAPAGITLRELVDEHCGGMAEGHELRAWLPGGASGGLLPASMADLPLDFDTLQPHGCFIGSAAVIVLSRQDDLRAAVRNLVRFFRNESCGQCTPCRSGTARLDELLAQPRWDGALIGELATAMADASICGLGQAAPNPLVCAIRHFPELLEGAR